MFVHTGDYVEHVSNDALQSTYYTFTPCPLLHGDFYIMDDDLAALLASAHRTIGMLEGMTFSISDKELFRQIMMFRECCYSKAIDSPDFDIKSVITEQGVGDAGILNNVSAYQYALETDISKLNYDDIFRRIVNEDASKKKAHTRSKQIFLSNTTVNYRKYNPTAPENISTALHDIRKYVESSETDAVIKAALCLYQFEMIHPYEYGNGLVGRILIYKILSSAGIKGVCYMNISEYLYSHKGEYFDKLGAAQKHGNYREWIDFFIHAIDESAWHTIELMRACEEAVQSDMQKIATRGAKSPHMAVYEYFKENVASSVKYASQQLNLSYNVVSRSVEILKEFNILIQITTGSRNRIFAHKELLRIILR